MLGSTGVSRDERQVDVSLLERGELDLRLLGGFLQALQRHAILAKIDTFRLLELIGQEVDDDLVEVVTTEVRVAIRRLNLEDAIGEIEDRDVVGATTEVVDRDLLVALVLQTVGQRGRRRLVDDASGRSGRQYARRLSSHHAGQLSKYAGTVMTAWSTFSPRYASASVPSASAGSSRRLPAGCTTCRPS